MDITVCVMLPERGAVDYSVSAHPKWRVLAPVAVTLMGDTSQPIAALRTGYIHVTNIPSRPQWTGLTNMAVLGVLTSKICKHGGLEKRQWAGSPASLPQNLARQLLEDRQITITWGQFKAFFRDIGNNRSMADEDLD